MWFKVDDQLAFHRKTVAAGNAAMGLWVRAGSWCAMHLTDGHVPAHMVALIGTPAQARRLVKAGLWIEVPDGYLFHQWGEEGRQPSAQKVRDLRKKSADRQADFRERKYGKPQVTDTSNDVSHTVSNGVTNAVTNSAPTRPDPTRTSSSGNLGGGSTERNARTTTESPPKRPRCERHRDLDDDDPGPACHGCRDARLAEQDSASAAAAASRAQRANAIALRDNCDQCDDSGWRHDTPDGAPLVKCTHRPLRSVG